MGHSQRKLEILQFQFPTWYQQIHKSTVYETGYRHKLQTAYVDYLHR